MTMRSGLRAATAPPRDAAPVEGLTRYWSALLVLLLLLKAYAVSRYSLTTTGALVTSAPLTVFLGTVASYLYFALPALAVGLPWWLWRTRKRTMVAEYRAVAVGLALTAFLLCPVPNSGWKALARMALYVAVVVFALVAVYTVTRRRRGDTPKGSFVAAGFALLLVPTLDQPWVPAEVLVVRPPGATIDVHPRPDGTLQTTRYPVAYVLAEGDGWTSALHAETRMLMRIRSSDLVLRQVCHAPHQLPGSRPVWHVIRQRPYDSPNTSCHLLVDDHARRLDPLVELVVGKEP